MNQVFSRYELENEEGYQTIRDADLESTLGIIEGTASRAITAELDRIVAELDAGGEKLPAEAIREAREHRDLMIPRLIKVLQDTATGARAGRLPCLSGDPRAEKSPEPLIPQHKLRMANSRCVNFAAVCVGKETWTKCGLTDDRCRLDGLDRLFQRCRHVSFDQIQDDHRRPLALKEIPRRFVV